MNVSNGAKKSAQQHTVVIDYELLTLIARLLNNLRSKKVWKNLNIYGRLQKIIGYSCGN